MLWCRWCSSACAATTVSALARMSSTSAAAQGSTGRFRFGQLAKQTRTDRRRVAVAVPATAQSEALLEQWKYVTQRQPRKFEMDPQNIGGFEFGALARASSLVDPEAAQVELDLQLEEASDAMVHKAAAAEAIVIDEDLRPDHRPLATVGRKHDEGWYLRRIDKLAESGDTAGIVRLLHRDMIGEGRYLPTRRIMHTVMRHLASTGAFEEVKEVLNRCRSAGVEPNHITHCHYLNSLAKAPCDSRPDRCAGELAYRYYDTLCRDSDYSAQHRFVYYCAVLACARNGLVQEAFKVFDDSVTIGQHHPQPVMLDALLQACYTDRVAGTAIALLVWRRYRLSFGGRLGPRHYYRLLRCLRACGLGPPDLLASAEATAGPPERTTLLPQGGGSAVALRQLQDGWSAALSAETARQQKMQSPQQALVQQPSLEFSLPAQPPAALALSCPINLLRRLRQPPPQLPDDALQLPWQRLTLVGGITGLLEAMQADDAELTQAIALVLVELLPPIPEAEQILMRLCRSRGLHRDAFGPAIYNALLRYRVRYHLGCADLLDEMRSTGLKPDRDTYVALGGACDSQQTGERLLADMAREYARPDQGIFYAMLSTARPADLAFKTWLVRRMAGFDVLPSPAIVRRIEADLALCRSLLAGAASHAYITSADLRVDMGSGKASPVSAPVDPEEYQRFRFAYESWLKANPLFKSSTDVRFERLRLKQERLKSLKL